MSDRPLGASFRDPSGFVFERDGVLYRRVNRPSAEHYDRLMSGLYPELHERGHPLRAHALPDAQAVSRRRLES